MRSETDDQRDMFGHRGASCAMVSSDDYVTIETGLDKYAYVQTITHFFRHTEKDEVLGSGVHGHVPAWVV